MRNARRRDGTSQIMSRFRDASFHGEERSHGACLGILLIEHLFPTVLTFHTCLLPTALWSAREGHSCCLVVGNRSQVTTWLRATLVWVPVTIIFPK